MDPQKAEPPQFSGQSRSVTIRYTTTRGDLWYAHVRRLFRQRPILVIWALLVVWVSWQAMHDPKIAGHSLEYRLALLVLTVAQIVFFLVTFTLVALTILVFARKHRGIVGEHTVTARADGLVEATVYNESLFRWEAYERTIKSGRYLLLYVTDSMYLIISRRRPLLEGDLDAFEAAVLQYSTKGAAGRKN